MKARVTVLGSGTSHGVPMIGCTCAVCRFRPIRATAARGHRSISMLSDGPAILIDTSTDLRHAGADPRRHQASTRSSSRTATPITSWAWMKCAASTPCERRTDSLLTPTSARSVDLRRTFYVRLRSARTKKAAGIPQIGLLDDRRRASTIDGVSVEPVPILHGSRPILGFRLARSPI